RGAARSRIPKMFFASTGPARPCPHAPGADRSAPDSTRASRTSQRKEFASLTSLAAARACSPKRLVMSRVNRCIFDGEEWESGRAGEQESGRAGKDEVTPPCLSLPRSLALRSPALPFPTTYLA